MSREGRLHFSLRPPTLPPFGTFSVTAAHRYASGTSHAYAPAWRFRCPVLTFRIKYPVGIVPLEGSAITAAGLIWSHVPGVPAPVQRHSPPEASRQNSFRTRAPEAGGPLIVVGLPFWDVATCWAIDGARMANLSAVSSRNGAAVPPLLCGGLLRGAAGVSDWPEGDTAEAEQGTPPPRPFGGSYWFYRLTEE